MEPRHQISERINANFVGGRKERIGIESLIKQKMRRTIHAHGKVVLRSIRFRDYVRYFATEVCLRGFRQRWQVQSSIQPDAPFYPRAYALAGKLERLESDDERGNNIAGLSGKNRYYHYFVHSFTRDIATFREVPNLLHPR